VEWSINAENVLADAVLRNQCQCSQTCASLWTKFSTISHYISSSSLPYQALFHHLSRTILIVSTLPNTTTGLQNVSIHFLLTYIPYHIGIPTYLRLGYRSIWYLPTPPYRTYLPTSEGAKSYFETCGLEI